MMFSTKAEYGVRVMVELARRSDGEPIPLAEIAANDGLPLAYLEHLVARIQSELLRWHLPVQSNRVRLETAQIDG